MVYSLLLAIALQDTIELGIAGHLTLRPQEGQSAFYLAGLGLPQLNIAGWYAW